MVKDDIRGNAAEAKSSGSAHAHRGAFSRKGEFWRIAYDGESFLLKHSKGLAYLEQLLRFPRIEFHALDLAGGIAGAAGDSDDISLRARSSLPLGDDALASAGIHVGGLGDAGEMLDEQAKAQYRRRLDELREELDEAKRLGKVEPADRAETEISALTEELSRAVGLGGRNRHAASASERARQSVTHAIKSAIERIGENHQRLGALLSRWVKTGNSCQYYPDPALSVEWEFGVSDNQHKVSGNQYDESVPVTSLVEVNTSQTSGFDALRPPVTPAPNTRSQTQIVGRETELAQLRGAAERAIRGHGAIVLLGGGPGVGKTRLAKEFLAQGSQRGFACFSGRCYERDEPHPLMPFVEIIEATVAQASNVEQFRTLVSDDCVELAQIAPGLRRVFQDLPTPAELPTAQVRRYLFQSLFDFIARMSRVKPLLLVLDDLHWADESTLAMVNFLANRVEHVPILVLAVYRDEELDATRPLTRTLEELLRLGIHPIKLRGLPRDGVAEMLAGLSQRQPPEHLITLVFEETQGNPFFVEEVFSHLAEEGRIFDAAGNFRQSPGSDDLTVPDNVRLVLGRRLGRLSDNSREILSAAAVIGRSFSYTLLEAMLERTDPDALFDGLEEAQRTGFITSSSQDPEAPFAFSHELVRQTLLAGIAQPRQQRLHLRIAQALEKVYGARIEERGAEVAHHLLKCGPFADPGKAAHYLSLAGQSSLRTGNLEDARRRLSSALAYQQMDAAKHAQTLADLACAERGLGDWSAAVVHLQDALGLYASVGDLRAIGRIVFQMAESFVWTGQCDEAVEIAQRGLSHLGSDESLYRARLLALLAHIRAVRGDFASAMKTFDETLALSAGTPSLARVLAYRSLCHFYFLRLQDALEDSRKSAALSNPQDSPWTHALALSVIMRSLYYLGKADQAVRIAMELEPLARDVGQLAASSFCVSIQAWAEFGRQPDLDVLDRKICDVVTFNRGTHLSLFLGQSLAQMSLVRFFAGDWDSAWSKAEEARAAELPGVYAGPGAATLLRLAAYSADRDRVLQLVDQVEQHLPIPGRLNTIGAWTLLMGMVEALAVAGEQQRTARFYPQVSELLKSGVVCMSFAWRFPETLAGIAAGAAGLWELAEKHFETALKYTVELPQRLEEAEVQRFHAMMLLWRNRDSDRERVREMLVRAADSYQQIGMPRHLELTRRLLSNAGR
jgi:tetratricopeptide (TPR) repeat protein